MKTDDINRLIDQRQALYVDKSAHEAENVHGNVDNVNMSEERVHKTDKFIHEPVAWMLHGELFWPSEYEVISEAGDNAIPLYVVGDLMREVGRLTAVCKEKDELIKLLKEEVGFAERGYTKRYDV